MISGQTGYLQDNNVVLTGDIASTFNNFALATSIEQIHLEHLMETTRQLTDTKKFMGDKIKHLAKTNVIMARQGQEN